MNTLHVRCEPPTHPQFKNLTGRKFKRLKVLKFIGRSKLGRPVYLCECKCGNRKVVIGASLLSGRTKSCGCYNIESIQRRNRLLKTTHGHSKQGKVSREYQAWKAAKKRCYNPKDKGYSNYGAIGVRMCRQWRESFNQFLKDMGRCPKGMELDRRNSRGNYTPKNCRWATELEQQNNRRRHQVIEAHGLKMNLSQWARHLDIKRCTLETRLRLGWTHEEITSKAKRRRAA